MSDSRSKAINKKNGLKTAMGPSASPKKPAIQVPGGLAGAMVFMVCMLLVAALAGVSLEPPGKIFIEGEIAAQDVTAPRDILIEDQESTRNRKEQVALAQPPVFDLTQIPFAQMARKLAHLLELLASVTPENQSLVQEQVAEKLNAQIVAATWTQWTGEAFLDLVHDSVIPWMEEAYQRGVIADRRFVSDITTGILIRDLSADTEQLHLEVGDFQDLSGISEVLDAFLRDADRQPQAMRRAVMSLVAPLLRPNLTLNQEASQARLTAAVQAVDPVFYQIKKGEIIVRKGERVSLAQQVKMQTLFPGRQDMFLWGRAGGVFLVSLAFAMGIFHSARGLGRRLSPKDALLLGATMIIFAALAKFVAFSRLPFSQELASLSPDVFIFSLPVAGAAGLLAFFFPIQVCLFCGALLSFLCTQMLHAGFDAFLFFLVGTTGYALFLRGGQTRTDILKTAPPLLAILLGTWTGLNLINFQDLAWFASGAAFVIAGALLSTMLLLALSPAVEFLFGYTSRFKLMELMSLEQPLLQSLMVNAPGTYHHCLIVSNMAEAGARAIDANPLLAKVAGLYHDIGKLKNPLYFIENQYGCENKHDKLAPSMSALILIAHVKKGAEMAATHKLGPEISDMIKQHHGTRLITYFHQKALAQAGDRGHETVREYDFRYPGPRPQSKEAGIILLADAIEASSRTLVDPTPSRIKNHIQNMVRNVFNEGQLDESDLSLKDLHILNDTFQRILTGIFHQRIHYPKAHDTDAAPPAAKAEKGKMLPLRLAARP